MTTIGINIDGIPTSPRALASDPRFLDPELRDALYPPLRDRLGKLAADRLWDDAHIAAGFWSVAR
jgi:hypothetical protein